MAERSNEVSVGFVFEYEITEKLLPVPARQFQHASVQEKTLMEPCCRREYEDWEAGIPPSRAVPLRAQLSLRTSGPRGEPFGHVSPTPEALTARV